MHASLLAIAPLEGENLAIHVQENQGGFSLSRVKILTCACIPFDA